MKSNEGSTAPGSEGAASDPIDIPARAPEPPWQFPGNDLIIGFEREGRGVSLPYQDRAKHVYIAGRTGTGKSRLLQSMIRQDLARHAATNCPTVVFDLHGELVESLLHAMACDVRFRSVPTIVIDFTDRNSVIKWNPLKRHKNIDSAVSAQRMAEAVMHASGGLDLTQSPTLWRTMLTFFHVGIEQSLSIPQLFELSDPSAHGLRAQAAAAIDDVRTRADLLRMNSLSKPRLEEEMLAFHNRLSGLTANPYLRAMMNVAEGGFSFADVLKSGSNVFFNLAASGGLITETNAKMIAALGMTELWQAAQSRGKGAAGARRPCYVYVDEAPFIATPTIALELAQARGFGLHFTLAAQATSQFEDFGGAYGHAIKKAVLRDTLTKIILGQTADAEDITPIARELGLAYYDPLRRKHTTTTYQVIGEDKEEYWTISWTETAGTSEGTNAATALSTQQSRSWHWAKSTSAGGGIGTSDAKSVSNGIVTPELLAAETHQGRISRVATDGTATNAFTTWNSAATEGGAEATGDGKTITLGTSKAASKSAGRSAQQHFRWRPIIKEAENPQFLTFDEQIHLWEHKLFTLHPRHALLSRQGMLAVEIATPTVRDPDYVDARWVSEMLAHFRAKHGFSLSLAEARALAAPITDARPSVTSLPSYGRRTVLKVANGDTEKSL